MKIKKKKKFNKKSKKKKNEQGKKKKKKKKKRTYDKTLNGLHLLGIDLEISYFSTFYIRSKTQ